MPNKATVVACRMVLVPLNWVLKLIQLALFKPTVHKPGDYRRYVKWEWTDKYGNHHVRTIEYERPDRR